MISRQTVTDLRTDRANGLGYVQLATKYDVAVSTAHRYCSDIRPRATVGFGSEAPHDPSVAAPIPVGTPDAVHTPDPAIHCPPEYRFSTSRKHADAGELNRDHDFEELYWQYRDYIGWKKDPTPFEDGGRGADGLELSVVVGDLHVPYENPDCLNWMIRRTQKIAKRCIVIGDLADMFYFAKYMKFKQHYTPLQELMRVQATLNLLSESFEEVVLMQGNHDERFIKYLVRNGLHPEVIAVFEYLHGKYALHPTYVLAHKLRNVRISEPAVKDYAEFGYLYQHGDCIMSHAEKFSIIPNKVVGEVIKSLKSYHEPQGLVRPFSMVVQAHTHQAGKTWNDYNVIGIENGCMALTPDYSGQARSLPVRRPMPGFTELWQDACGKSDPERSNFIPYQG